MSKDYLYISEKPLTVHSHCTTCRHDTTCYKLYKQADRLDLSEDKCIPCLYHLSQQCGSEDVTLSDAAAAIGECVWCDEKRRPLFTGAVGVVVSVFAHGLGGSSRVADVALLNTIARLCTNTPRVRIYNLRLWCRRIARHRCCVFPVRVAEGHDDEGFFNDSPTSFRSALCSVEEREHGIDAFSGMFGVLDLLGFGNFALACKLEEKIFQRLARSSPENEVSERRENLHQLHVAAAIELGDRGLFFSALKDWNPAKFDSKVSQNPIVDAVMTNRGEFVMALAKKGCPIPPTVTKHAIQQTLAGYKINPHILHCILHSLARQNGVIDGDSLSLRPKLPLSSITVQDFCNVALLEFFSDPTCVQLLLEFGADPGHSQPRYGAPFTVLQALDEKLEYLSRIRALELRPPLEKSRKILEEALSVRSASSEIEST